MKGYNKKIIKNSNNTMGFLKEKKPKSPLLPLSKPLFLGEAKYLLKALNKQGIYGEIYMDRDQGTLQENIHVVYVNYNDLSKALKLRDELSGIKSDFIMNKMKRLKINKKYRNIQKVVALFIVAF